MSVLLLLSMACVEKRIMPEKLRDKLVYDIDIEETIVSENREASITHALTVAIELQETNRDDSLRLRLEFVEASWRDETATENIQSPLQGEAFFVTAFPWGEMLKVDGWAALPAAPHQDNLDIIIPLLFPNPPIREAQQWNYRVLPWRYHGVLPEDYLRLNQKIIASWKREEEKIWSYQGDWEARTRLEPIVTGTVSGVLEKSGVWIDSHEWSWSRQILYPEVETQHFKGKIIRLEQK